MYTAPDSLVTDTICSVANSVNDNGDLNPDDKWNFGENFPVTIIANPVYVDGKIILDNFELSQNYPNPFNPSTKISFKITEAGLTSLKVFDALGNEVAILVNEVKPTGIYEIEFGGNDLTSGIYFYQLRAGAFIETKKMVLMK